MTSKSRKVQPGFIRPKTVTELREKAKLSISAVAREAGIDPSYLWKIEAGEKNPTPAVAARIARALGFSLEVIYDLNPEADIDLYVFSMPKAVGDAV